MVYSVKLIVNVIARACDCEEDRIFCILLSIARNLQIVTNHWVSGVCVRMCAILKVLRAHVSKFFFYKFSSQVSCCSPTLVAKQPIHDDKKCPRTLESCAKVNSFCTQFTLFYLK